MIGGFEARYCRTPGRSQIRGAATLLGATSRFSSWKWLLSLKHKLSALYGCCLLGSLMFVVACVISLLSRGIGVALGALDSSVKILCRRPKVLAPRLFGRPHLGSNSSLIASCRSPRNFPASLTRLSPAQDQTSPHPPAFSALAKLTPDRRSGLYKLDLPFTQGQDVVGTIASIPNPNPSNLKLGERVWAPAGASFAEYTTASADKVVPMPEGVDPKDGVSMCTVALTAVTLVREAYAVKKGDWVLIRAAAGGVGLVLVQLCKHLGANVIATVSTEAKAELARENGADHVLLSTAESETNVKKINELSDGGVNVVYDGVGKDTWDEDFEVVRVGGTIVTFGNASGPVPAFSPLKLSPKCLKVTRPTLFPFIAKPEDFKRHAEEVSRLAKEGVLKFRVHKVYPFTEEGVRQTQIDITGRGTTGKLLIHVSGDEAK